MCHTLGLLMEIESAQVLDVIKSELVFRQQNFGKYFFSKHQMKKLDKCLAILHQSFLRLMRLNKLLLHLFQLFVRLLQLFGLLLE